MIAGWDKCPKNNCVVDPEVTAVIVGRFGIIPVKPDGAEGAASGNAADAPAAASQREPEPEPAPVTCDKCGIECGELQGVLAGLTGLDKLCTGGHHFCVPCWKAHIAKNTNRELEDDLRQYCVGLV